MGLVVKYNYSTVLIWYISHYTGYSDLRCPYLSLNDDLSSSVGEGYSENPDQVQDGQGGQDAEPEP